MPTMTAAVSTCNTYTRRRPELTPCYQVIQSEFETFAAEREAEARPLPPHVSQEFYEYLKCGIPAYGFLRLACKSCKEEKIVAFSCKKRGFCPSCCAKRAAESATHLVDNVLPLIAYRQFVITFPIPMRFWLQTNKKLYAKIHKLVITELHSYYIDKAKALGIKNPTPGTISFTQRFGSALNLNIHMHVLCADGVYTRVDGKPLFRNLDAITDGEVARLIEAISQKAMHYLKKQGYLDKDGELVRNPLLDELFDTHEALSGATAASIAGKIAFGPNAGNYVTRIGKGFGYGEEIPLAKGKRCFSVHGFSLHANTHVNALARDRLEKLIHYIARGPLSNERLELTDDHRVKLRLKNPYSDGTTHLLFTYGEFIEKLVALVPPPSLVEDYESQVKLGKDLTARIVFGSKSLLKKRHHLKENGYRSADEWKDEWQFTRHNAAFFSAIAPKSTETHRTSATESARNLPNQS
ncbi:MAG: transposase [Oligoflexus sp.]